MPILPPLIAAALLAVAGLAATRLPTAPWLVRLLRAAATASPLGWYLVGVVLGPGLGLLDRSLLAAGAPVLACAAGWVGASAGARLAAPVPPDDRLSPRTAADVGAALLLPAGLLFAAGRFLPHPLAPAWPPVGPVIATLTAAVAVTTVFDARRGTIVALAAAAGAQLARLPRAPMAGLPGPVVWIACAIVGTVAAGLLAHRLGRGTASPLPSATAGIAFGAGVGLATGISPLVVCALAGFALARWSQPFTGLAADLAPSEPAVTATLWVAAGAQIGGPFPAVAVAAVLLALWPIVRRRLATLPLPFDRSVGLAVALGCSTAATPAVRPVDTAILTAAALALLFIRVAPGPEAIVESRLTSGGRRVEVTA